MQNEYQIYVTIKKPTEIIFPGAIAGGINTSGHGILIEHSDNILIAWRHPTLAPDGTRKIFHLKEGEKEKFVLHFIPADEQHLADTVVKLLR